MSQRKAQNQSQSSNRASTSLAVLAAAGIGAIVGFLGHSLWSERESAHESDNATASRATPVRSVPIQPDKKCVICQEELKAPMEQMPCSHIFHQNCLITWLENSPSCPTCRNPLSERQLSTYRNRTAY